MPANQHKSEPTTATIGGSYSHTPQSLLQTRQLTREGKNNNSISPKSVATQKSTVDCGPNPQHDLWAGCMPENPLQWGHRDTDSDQVGQALPSTSYCTVIKLDRSQCCHKNHNSAQEWRAEGGSGHGTQKGIQSDPFWATAPPILYRLY